MQADTCRPAPSLRVHSSRLDSGDSASYTRSLHLGAVIAVNLQGLLRRQQHRVTRRVRLLDRLPSLLLRTRPR